MEHFRLGKIRQYANKGELNDMNYILKVIIICYIITIASFFTIYENVLGDYYVAPDGSDESEGSLVSPWQSIQHAVNQAVSGDVINVREGIYKEMIVISKKEALYDQWITIQNYSDEKPIIDMESLDIPSSQRAGFEIIDSVGIRIKGFEIRNLTTDSQKSFPAGILVRGKNKNIEIIENDIHHIANYANKGNAHGILVYGDDPQPIENIKILKNQLHDLTLGRSESLTLSGNVKYFTIEGNYVFRNNNIGIDVAGHYGACSSNGCEDYARNGVISNNVILYISSANNPAYKGDNSAAGIYVDGAKNVVVEKNYVSKNDYGISLSSEKKGFFAKNITLKDNYVARNAKAGLVIGGAGNDNGGAANISVINNMFSMNDRSQEGYREITIQHHASGNDFSGNIYFLCGSKNYINFQKNQKDDNNFKNEYVYNMASCKK